MYASLHGTLLDKSSTNIMLYVHGVGYEIQVSNSTLQRLPQIGSKVFLFTYLKVAEDSQTLYGFGHAAEKLLFQELIKLNKVGPKVALAILGMYAYKDLLQIVADKNSKALVKVSGVGKTLAERMMVDLNNRLPQLNELVIVGNHHMQSLAQAFKIMNSPKSPAHATPTKDSSSIPNLHPNSSSTDNLESTRISTNSARSARTADGETALVEVSQPTARPTSDASLEKLSQTLTSTGEINSTPTSIKQSSEKLTSEKLPTDSTSITPASKGKTRRRTKVDPASEVNSALEAAAQANPVAELLTSSSSASNSSTSSYSTPNSAIEHSTIQDRNRASTDEPRIPSPAESESLFLVDPEDDIGLGIFAQPAETNTVKLDAINALISLGLKDKEAEKIISAIYKPEYSTEQLIRLALTSYNKV